MDQNQIPADIRNYLENLMQDAGVIAQGELREEMMKELFLRLDSYIITEVVDKMPADKLDEFIRLNEEKKSKEELEAYITQNMPNAQEVFANAFMSFRDLYIGAGKPAPKK